MLYQELPFLDRFDTAARDGFEAVESHPSSRNCNNGAVPSRIIATLLELSKLRWWACV
jgi:hydroxypyruvate isomerase